MKLWKVIINVHALDGFNDDTILVAIYFTIHCLQKYNKIYWVQ